MCYWLLQAPFIAAHRTWNSALNLKMSSSVLDVPLLYQHLQEGDIDKRVQYGYVPYIIQIQWQTSTSISPSTSIRIVAQAYCFIFKCTKERACKDRFCVCFQYFNIKRSQISKLLSAVKLLNSHRKCILYDSWKD